MSRNESPLPTIHANDPPNDSTYSSLSQENDQQDAILKEAIDDFDKMKLNENLLRGIYAYGFEKPSMIQQMAITKVTTGRDIIVQAQSGTGKTATYSIGLLQQLKIDKKNPTTQGLILVPTRELADQVNIVVQAIGDYLDVEVHTCVGGTSVQRDISILRRNPAIVVGTPGRMWDMIEKRALDTSSLRCVILDEADEILSAGFQDAIKGIFRAVNRDCQLVVVSATLPPQIHDLVEPMLNDPLRVTVPAEKLSLSGIYQYYVDCSRDEHKLGVLVDLFQDISISQAVIFCNSIKRVEWLNTELAREGFPVDCIHAGLKANERSDVMKKFRICEIRVLICSDLIARGIDVQQVSVVINFDLPKSRDTYLHRIGRSGRFGRKGVSINFITDRDLPNMRDIERHYKITINELPADVMKIIQ